MLIETQATPNPEVLKFLPGRVVMAEEAGRDFANAEEAKGVDLAETLFAIKGVAAVFLGADFIAIRKEKAIADWAQIKPDLLGALVDYCAALAENQPLAAPMKTPPAKAAKESPAEGDVEGEIRHLLDLYVRPAVARDGGDIVFKSYHEGVLTLHLRGACAGCPSSALTLKQGIENLLRHYVPQLREVRADEASL